MCLSYFHLKKYDILELEVKKSDVVCVKLIEQLKALALAEEEEEDVAKKMDALLEEKRIDAKDDLSRLILSSIYLRQKLYPKAIRVLSHLDTLPCHLALIGIYLAMNRVDLAENQLKVMQNKDDFSTLTLIAMAQIRLASGNAREAYDIAVELEDKFRATPLLKNLQTVAAVNMGNLEAGKQHCESSLDLDNDNIEALINMIYILSNLRAASEIKERHLTRIKTLSPNHEFIKEFQRLEIELSS